MISRNKVAMVLAIFAGIMLMFSGANGIGLWETIKVFVITYIIDHLAVQIFFAALIFIASLGGLSVIAGGLLIGKSRLTTGKLLIALGTGMGIIGLAVSIVIDYESGDFSINRYYSIGSLGVILSIAARMIAVKTGGTDKNSNQPQTEGEEEELEE